MAGVSIDYESLLNPAQLEAVTTLEGPILVIAGAGSGKTRTLVYRVARLVESGVRPGSILLLTFTRKAAQEMLDRASSLANNRCRSVSGGTFHSLARQVLTENARRLGFQDAFTILDRSDMEEILRSLVSELDLPRGASRFPKKATLANIVSKSANLGRDVETFVMEEYGQFTEFIEQLRKLGSLYTRYKKGHHLMDFDDLIINLRSLLAESEEVRGKLGRRYRYVMIDEYQDTNQIQADIAKWLAFEHRNIMVVGDDAQSIYSFRGANYRNMFEFPEQFPESKVIKLEENYRSTQPILSMTNSLMNQAAEKFTKCLFTNRAGGEAPRVVNTENEPEQAQFVCRSVEEALDQGWRLRDIAVLFRAGYHSFELEAELARRRIKYVKYGGFKFLESAHIKDFLAHLRVVVNTDDAVSWVRVLRLVENVGQAKTHRIIDWMRKERIPPNQIDQWPGLKKKDSGLRPLSELLSGLVSEEVAPENAVDLVMSYYEPILKERFDDYRRRKTELEQLAPMAGRYTNLKGFLDDLILEPPTSASDIGPEKGGDTLTLSTVHSAKGLEWRMVFIIWASEGRFPAYRALYNTWELEEERRLMYVAATRAKDRLVLCYPGSGMYGMGSGYHGGLSSFIQALPPDVVLHESMKEAPASASRNRVSRSDRLGSGEDQAGFSRGDRVSHPAFGSGVISKFVGGDKVEVLFREAGRKLLHLEYTTLDKI